MTHPTTSSDQGSVPTQVVGRIAELADAIRAVAVALRLAETRLDQLAELVSRREFQS